ncbi:MAG: CRTAC1 family protein, partial [Acidobacteria bacterium]|nr:CRTAC1 family protein [Acidobacteriota bacterium]
MNNIRHRTRLAVSLLGALTLFPAPPQTIRRATSGKQEPVRFVDATREAGIGFINASSTEKKYIVESVNGGTAIFDYDGDGRQDLYLLNSCTV